MNVYINLKVTLLLIVIIVGVGTTDNYKVFGVRAETNALE
jgi:hypothetical protein